MQKIIKKIINWFKSFFVQPEPELTAAQRRDTHCSNGQHRYNTGSAFWWVQNPDKSDSADYLTRTSTHCKDCGHWEIAGIKG